MKKLVLPLLLLLLFAACGPKGTPDGTAPSAAQSPPPGTSALSSLRAEKSAEKTVAELREKNAKDEFSYCAFGDFFYIFQTPKANEHGLPGGKTALYAYSESRATLLTLGKYDMLSVKAADQNNIYFLEGRDEPLPHRQKLSAMPVLARLELEPYYDGQYFRCPVKYSSAEYLGEYFIEGVPVIYSAVYSAEVQCFNREIRLVFSPGEYEEERTEPTTEKLENDTLDYKISYKVYKDISLWTSAWDKLGGETVFSLVPLTPSSPPA